MEAIALIFPHQLFEENPLFEQTDRFVLIEEHLFFNQYRFHKQKLMFHRASMKFYRDFLTKKGFSVSYIEAIKPESDIRVFLSKSEWSRIHVIDPVDNYLWRRFTKGCQMRGITYYRHQSPGFLNSKDELAHFFRPDKKKFFQTEFYKRERKRLDILIDVQGNPEGGQWTFDTENRKKFPSRRTPPPVRYPDKTKYHEEAMSYVQANYEQNHGRLAPTPLYCTDFESAKEWLQQFLETRFEGFGDYEDAMVSTESILHHSVLSPLINVGLLTPGYVISQILMRAREGNVGINNTEGLIRQLIGWREFIRGVYEAKGTAERTRNFWGFTRKMPQAFYEGSTGILPFDDAVKKVLNTSYNHHIERLMIIGNFMLLCELDPDEVYRWFMELYIDSYDWVMVPNVYGMSQFADGGLMSTKPYLSGSNYLIKMSNYKKGPWQQVWDGLFWRFMHVHRDFFLKNPRLGMLVRAWDKMDEDKRQAHLETAESFLLKLR